MNDTRTKLFIATPMYGGMCTASFMLSSIKLAETLIANNIQFEFAAIQNDALITRARNSLAHYFLNTDATHLFFVDGDIGYNPEDVIEMLRADKDVICGIYPKKEINWTRINNAVHQGVPELELKFHTGSFVVNFMNDTNTPPDIDGEPFEIAKGGTGFMLIQRKVFEKLKPTVPTYENESPAYEGDVSPTSEFFAVSVDKKTNRLLSEDYYFCNLVREAGMSIWAAPWAGLTHTGTYIFHGMSIRKELPRDS